MICWRPLLAAGLLAALGTTAGQAQEAPANLAGLWTFEADLQPVCRFKGQARLIPTDNPYEYDCELTAEQDCPSAGVRYTVEQSCRATLDGDIVTVRSTIQQFLEGEPTTNYLPDNFTLAIQTPSLLEGVLTGSSSYAAEWRRAEGAIS